MKKIALLSTLIICSLFAHSQNGIEITFKRASQLQGSAAKINISFLDQEITLRNGENETRWIPLESTTSITVLAKSLGGKETFTFDAMPNSQYTIEVGFALVGLYIRLADSIIGATTELDTTENKGNEWNSKLKVNRNNGSLSFKAETMHSSESIRQEWLKKGGKISYNSTMLNGTFFSLNQEDYGKINGFGGGISLFYNYINLKIPEYKPGITSWNSFNKGFGIDLLMYNTKFSMEEELFSTEVSTLNINMMLTFDLGWTVAFGKFKAEDHWIGVALLAKYRPSISLVQGTSTVNIISNSEFIPSSETTSKVDPSVSFNPGGFGFDLQLSNFYATMNQLAPKPTVKFTFFVLPPIGDNPLFISVGLGVLMYKN